MNRGVVRIKPVLIGIPHYQEVHGSVCSDDVEGTPPVVAPEQEELQQRARELADNFSQRTDVDFVQMDEPLLVQDHADLRRLSAELTYDTDALLVKGVGATPLILRTLSRYGLPLISGAAAESYLRGLRARKFLRESKFIYVGEIPSFSAPNGPWDFAVVERRLGVRVRHIETNQFFRSFDRFADEQVELELNELRGEFNQVLEPTDRDLRQATRVYLTLKELAASEDANGIAVNCGRLTEERPVVPCLAFARLIDEGITCACEGDITAMLSSLVIHAVSQRSTLMGNLGARPGQFEAREGEVTIEHDVIPRSMASDGFTVRDYHGRRFGVTGYAPIRTDEPMTLLNMDAELQRMSVLEGTIKGSEDGGHCRVIVRMSVDGDVRRVPEVMVGSQHVSMAFGHWLDAVVQAASLLGMEVRRL